ncbi:Flp pilus assembly protein CpaB [Yoonia sp. SS1-5]|uniref:Flp pilus assembly protein CpaB n=1 Tax=Yoonia rhodophyticola TaxID=3137370 RepID=A0AAN0MG13_9RHOB
MRALFGLVLLIGMGLAGFAVYTVNGYFETQNAVIEQERARAAQAVKTVDVYAPTRALTYGDLVTAEDVQLIKYAEEFLPEGAFQTEEELFPQGVGTPRVVTRPMEVNEPILAVKVTEPGQPRGITALLDRGMRAFPIPDSVTDAFAEELRPTDRLDIFWTGNLSNGSSTTRLIMTNLEVIAVEEPDADGNGGGRGVVVQVTPSDFAALETARNAGRLSLTPVGTNDDTVIETAIQTNIEDVLGIEEVVVAPAPVQQQEQKCFITERNGTEKVQVEIQCPTGN